MKINNVLLIKPYYYSSHYDNRFLPTGLAYVSEALNKAAIRNKIFDMGLGYSLGDLKKEIEEFKPQLLGISVMSFGYKNTYRMIESVKESYPSISIVVGGPHLSTLRENVLEECQAINFGITLEGEETIVELCRGDKPLSEIKGLIFRNNSGNIIYNGDRDFITDLDQNGFPRYSKVELNKYPRFINIVTSRGCPYQCMYCPVHRAIGERFRVRSPGSVANEFEYWYKRGYREFEIADDNFTLQRDRVSEICAELRKRGLSGLRISCGNGIRADRIDRDLLIQMKEVGFYYIAFGVEAGNNRILKGLKKGESIEAIERAIGDACALGYKVTLFFLLGSPGETKADVEDSVRLALRYPVYDARFYNLIPFPGTELYDWVVANGYFVSEQEGYEYLNDASHWVNDPIFQTPELPTEERKRLYQWANAEVQRHTAKVKKKFYQEDVDAKFRQLGLPAFLINQLAKLYVSREFQCLFVKTKLINKLRVLFIGSRWQGWG